MNKAIDFHQQHLAEKGGVYDGHGDGTPEACLREFPLSGQFSTQNTQSDYAGNAYPNCKADRATILLGQGAPPSKHRAQISKPANLSVAQVCGDLILIAPAIGNQGAYETGCANQQTWADRLRLRFFPEIGWQLPIQILTPSTLPLTDGVLASPSRSTSIQHPVHCTVVVSRGI